MKERALRKAVSTIEGGCGSGKTTAALNWIANTGLKTLYVCEKIELCEEVSERLPRCVNHKLINSDTDHRVSDEINRIIQHQLWYYDVLIITWASYQQIDPVLLENFDYVFLDDINQAVSFIELNLGKANHVLLDELSVINELSFRKDWDSIHQIYEYYELSFNKSVKDTVQELATDYKKQLMELATKSRSHHLYIEKEKYDRLINNEFDYSQTKKVNPRNVVTIYLSPRNELFPRNVVLVSEGLSDCNQVARILRDRGIRLEPHIFMQPKVITEFPPNKCKVNLHALCEDDITRYLLESDSGKEGYANNAEYLADIANKFMKDKHYIYIMNEHLKFKKIDSILEKGKMIATKNRGSNRYSDYHNVVCLTSMNLDNEKQNLLEFIDGIDYEAFKRDIQMANDLQTIFRTAIRNVHRYPDQEIEINAIVPDYKTMLFLVEKMEPYYEVTANFIDGYIPAKERFNKEDWNKSHYEENKETIRSKQKDYYEDNKETLKEKRKQRYDANKEKEKRARRERYLKNKESKLTENVSTTGL